MSPLEATTQLMSAWGTVGLLKGLDPDELRVKTVELLLALKAVEKPQRATRKAKTPETTVQAAKPTHVRMADDDLSDKLQASIAAQAPPKENDPW